MEKVAWKIVEWSRANWMPPILRFGSPTLRQKKTACDTRVIPTHPCSWDSLRAARSVPRHWLRAGIRLRRTSLDALASRPCPTPAPLPFESPTLRHKSKAPLGGAFWRRVGDSNPRKTCAFTRFPGVLLKPLGQLSRSWLPLCTGNIEGNTRVGLGQERVFEVIGVTDGPLALS